MQDRAQRALESEAKLTGKLKEADAEIAQLHSNLTAATRQLDGLSGVGGGGLKLGVINRASLLFEKYRNIDCFRGFIEKLSLFLNRSEALGRNKLFTY